MNNNIPNQPLFNSRLSFVPLINAWEKIAAEGKGQFIRATNNDDGLSTIMTEITKMDKKSFGTKMFTEYEDRFQYFIGAGLLFLLIEFMISNRKSEVAKRINLFGEERK